MILKKETSLLSIGDFIDVYLKLQKKGKKYLLSKLFNFSYQDKVASKWDNFGSESDFWIIPEIKALWNKSISGNPDVTYEEYVSKKYFEGQVDLSFLSIGCGEGIHERNFHDHLKFTDSLGIDISIESIKKAQELADIENKNISYQCANFNEIDFEDKKFDLILFDSSLHHFENIDYFLTNKIKPLLKNNGFMVVFEYCGPNRLQWRKAQLDLCNKVLLQLPAAYKYFNTNKLIKKKVYRPGLLRVYFVDPSEAPDSENLISAVHKNFQVVEEHKIGMNIIQPLLKGIAHNFLENTAETKKWIDFVIEQEHIFLNKSDSKTDYIFGVYQLKN